MLSLLGIVGTALGAVTRYDTIVREGDNNLCYAEGKLRILFFHLHVQKEVSQAIQSIIDNGGNRYRIDRLIKADGSTSQFEGVKSFLWGRFEALNEELINFNIQIFPIIVDENLQNLNFEGAIDASCEYSPPASERTLSLASSLLKTGRESTGSVLDATVGLHLYLFGCLGKNLDIKTNEIIHHGSCGRVIGLLWENESTTYEKIKDVVIAAISSNSVAAGERVDRGTSDLQGGICSYVDKCLSYTGNSLGMVITEIPEGLLTRETYPDFVRGDSVRI